MSTMFMTIGPQGAGKDYQIAKHPRLSKLTCLTPDDFVVGAWNPKKWKVVYKFVNKTFKMLLKEGESFIINDIFTHPAKRKWYIKQAKKKGYLAVAVFLDVDLETCLEQNKKRGFRGHYGLVPDDVIATIYSEYRQHTPHNHHEVALWKEGFDHIMTVRC